MRFHLLSEVIFECSGKEGRAQSGLPTRKCPGVNRSIPSSEMDSTGARSLLLSVACSG